MEHLASLLARKYPVGKDTQTTVPRIAVGGGHPCRQTQQNKKNKAVPLANWDPEPLQHWLGTPAPECAAACRSLPKATAKANHKASISSANAAH